MKRTVQMKNSGIPSKMQRSKFKGFRGVGSLMRKAAFALENDGLTNNWRAGEPLIFDYRKKQ